jgi:hypothetical protein
MGAVELQAMSERNCPPHEPWANDASLVVDWENGGGWIGDVRITDATECRRCGHSCDANELFEAFTLPTKPEPRP